jgi:hypothetical protein
MAVAVLACAVALHPPRIIRGFEILPAMIAHLHLNLADAQAKRGRVHLNPSINRRSNK